MIGKRDAAACFDRLVRERDAHSRGAANELVSEWSRILAQAFDERPARQKIWIAFGAFGNFDRAAGTAIWHLAAGAIRCSGGHASFSCGLGHGRNGPLGFVEKESILHRYFDAAVLSIDPKFSANLRVIGQRAENEGASARITKDDLNVVVSFASIMVRVYAAAADNGFRHGAKDPVGKVNQVRTE